MDSAQPLVVTRLESYTSTPGLYFNQAEALGVKTDAGQRVLITFSLGMSETDELFLAALIAGLRRVLPGIVEARARDAYDRIYPGALAQEAR